MIHTQNLTRDFKTIRTPDSSITGAGIVRAVDDLTLSIAEGIVFGFLGPNGSGKTTTIRLLLGLLEPTEGKAEVIGFDTQTQADAIRERTGALLEHTGLYERLSAEDNLEYYGKIYHLPASDRQARIRELLGEMGLWERRKEVVGGWSRGMKQKLAVARALLHRPRLVFLDEPMAGLDPVAAAQLREDLAQMANNRRTTIFLTTHNLTDAERLCHRVAVIRAGKLLAEGSPEELRRMHGGSQQAEIRGRGFTELMVAQIAARPDVVTARLINNHLAVEMREGADLAQVVSQVVTAGGMIDEIKKGKASLEDIFLELVEDKQETGEQ